MKKISVIFVIVLVLVSGCSQGADYEKEKIVALNATTFFQQRKDADFYILLDSQTKGIISETELSSEFDDIIKIYGSPKEIDSGSIVATKDVNGILVSVPVRFNNGWMDLTYVINSSSSVISFKITASDKLDESGYNETQYVYHTKDGSGNVVFTKANQSENSPLVVFLHDKDAFDKNYTIGVNKVFRNLAYALADQGIASLRYDRTILDNKDMEDSSSLILEELQAVLDTISDLEGIDDQRIYVFGYGLGGYLLPLFFDALDVSGYIIASSPSQDLYVSIYEERLYQLDCDISLSDRNKEVRRTEIENSKLLIESLVNPKDFYQEIFGYSSSFWIELKEYDAIQMVKECDQPVLITQGSNDYQVEDSSYNSWVNGLKDCEHVTLKYYKNVDHMFSVRSSQSVPSDQLKDSDLSKAFVQDVIRFVQDR